MPALLPSELPERCRTGHHWVVLLRPPHRLVLAALAVALVVAWFAGSLLLWLIIAVWIGGGFLLRFLTWRAELVILTGKRVIRLQGIPETTRTETSFRIDRISGARLIETVPGKILGYGTIELEAPGDHPGVRKLVKIRDAVLFYRELRDLIFNEPLRPRPEDPPGRPRRHGTKPLPVLPSPRHRHRR